MPLVPPETTGGPRGASGGLKQLWTVARNRPKSPISATCTTMHTNMHYHALLLQGCASPPLKHHSVGYIYCTHSMPLATTRTTYISTQLTCTPHPCMRVLHQPHNAASYTFRLVGAYIGHVRCFKALGFHQDTHWGGYSTNSPEVKV